MPNTLLHVIGPPGTGKTHTLLDEVERLINEGNAPRNICFCSFTRSAIQNARERVQQRFGLRPDDIPYFGTLHSLCFRYLGLTKDQVFAAKPWEEFCQAVNLRFTEQQYGDVDDDLYEPLGEEEGDILRRWYDGCRNRLLGLETAIKGSGLHPERARWFVREVEAYKGEKGLFDFIDMIQQAVTDGWRPPADVLILDEAQDVSPLQLRLWNGWVGHAETVILGYDEDQTIYEFQGADPGWLLEFPHTERRFLRQSFRVPRLPAAIARRIIQRNQLRYPKDWEPKAADGEVFRDWEVEAAVDLMVEAADPKPWFFLARNRCFLDRITSCLRAEGIPFLNLRGPSPRPAKGMVAAFRLAQGEAVLLDEVRLLAARTTAKDWWRRGAKTQLERLATEFPERLIRPGDLPTLGALPDLCGALARTASCLDPLNISEDNKSYFRRVYTRFGVAGITGDPLCHVGTQHSKKGQEAPGVVLAPNMTRRTAYAYDEWPEPERRVWYVGTSRTERTLILLAPERGAFFDEW